MGSKTCLVGDFPFGGMCVIIELINNRGYFSLRLKEKKQEKNY